MEWLIGRNYKLQSCISAEWHKHDIHPPMPQATGIEHYSELLQYYGFPLIHCYKPLDWWINSMLNHNNVTREVLHQELYLRELIEPEDIFDQPDPDNWVMVKCSQMYNEKNEEEVMDYVCGGTTILSFQHEIAHGVATRKSIHSSEKYAIHLDTLIKHWTYYHRVWKDNLTRLKKVNYPIFMINWDDLRQEGGQVKLMKRLVDSKILNGDIDNRNSVSLIPDFEDVTPNDIDYFPKKDNPYSNRVDKYKENNRYNLNDTQLKYIQSKTPKAIAKFFEKG